LPGRISRVPDMPVIPMRTLVISKTSADAVGSRLGELLHAAVDAQGPAYATYDAAEAALFHGPPDLIAVVLSLDPERGFEVLRRLRRGTSRMLLAVGPASDSRLILQALNCGADHFLADDDLELGLDGVLTRVAGKEAVAAPHGRFLAVLSCSGGCGASTLAVNIATALAREHGQCGLVDLKPGRGDLPALLDLRPQFHLADICRNLSRLDRAMFEKMVVRHASGVHLLGAPPSFGDARAVTPPGVSAALTMARRLYGQVVADLEDCFHEEQVTALRQATGILLVARLDFTALRNTRRVLDHLTQLGLSREIVRIVINHHGQPGELPVAQAEEALGEKLRYFIAEDPRTFNAANNTGIPVILKYPKTKIAQTIAELAKFAVERRRGERGAALVPGAGS
jgi:pilus assembly protein CpaE